MTKQEQRIAIAEACGWQKVSASGGLILGWPPNCPLVDYPHREVPNYLNDLNAKMRAWGTLTPDQKIEFVQWLLRLEKMDTRLKPDILGPIIIESFESRFTETFLRTIGKWKD